LHCGFLPGRAHPQAQRPEGRAQAIHRDTGIGPQPRFRYAGADDERAAVLPLVGEAVQHRPQKVRSHPGMRHVADELRCGRVAPDHLGPVVPARRPLVGQEEAQQLVGPGPPAEPDEGPHRPELVGRVGLPGPALPSRQEVLVVLLKRPPERAWWERGRFADRRHGDGRRGRVEVTELDRPGQIIDPVAGHRQRERLHQIATKRVANPLEPRLVVGLTQHPRDLGRVLEALEGEEVVPVGVHRLGGIAFMADRLGQQTVERSPRRRLVLGRHSLPPQRIQVGDRAYDPGPHSCEEDAIAGVAVVLHEQIEKLAATVVLRHWIGPAAVDAAGHLAARVLKRRIPLDEVAHRLGLAQPEQRRRYEGAVPDPGTPVGAGAGLDRRAVAGDERVGNQALDRGDDGTGARRQTDAGASQPGVPPPRSPGQLSLGVGPRCTLGSEWPGRGDGPIERHREIDGAAGAGSHRQPIGQCAGCIAVEIVDPRSPGRRGRSEIARGDSPETA